MSIPAQAVKTVISGTLANGEVFSHSQWFKAASALDQTSLDGLVGAVVGSLGGNLLSAGNLAYFPSTTSWLQVTGYYYAGGSTAALTSIAPVAGKTGTSGGSALPNQCCEVVTLQTGVPGRSHRGRVYLPGVSTGNMVNGQVATSVVTALATGYQTFLQGVRDFPTYGLPPVVCSPRTSAMYDITTIRVDSRVDIQRSRANKQAANATVNKDL